MNRFTAMLAFAGLLFGAAPAPAAPARPVITQADVDRAQADYYDYMRLHRIAVECNSALLHVVAEGALEALRLGRNGASQDEADRWYAQWTQELDAKLQAAQAAAANPPRLNSKAISLIAPDATSSKRRYLEGDPDSLVAMLNVTIAFAGRVRADARAAAGGDRAVILRVTRQTLEGARINVEAEIAYLAPTRAMFQDDDPRAALLIAQVAGDRAVANILKVLEVRLGDPNANVGVYLAEIRAACAEQRAAAASMPALARAYAENIRQGRVIPRTSPAFDRVVLAVPEITTSLEESARVEDQMARLAEISADQLEHDGYLASQPSPLDGMRELVSRRVALVARRNQLLRG